MIFASSSFRILYKLYFISYSFTAYHGNEFVLTTRVCKFLCKGVYVYIPKNNWCIFIPIGRGCSFTKKKEKKLHSRLHRRHFSYTSSSQFLIQPIFPHSLIESHLFFFFSFYFSFAVILSCTIFISEWHQITKFRSSGPDLLWRLVCLRIF